MPKSTHSRKQKECIFDPALSLPTDWDTDPNTLNLSNDLIETCTRRISQQRTFDAKPLGIAVCYGCSHILWTNVDGAHTWLVNKPTTLTQETAPASRYLKAVPTCKLSFVYKDSDRSKNERWYACNYCRSACVPTEQHVGNVFPPIAHPYVHTDLLNVKPIKEWNMEFPTQIKTLTNQYERGQTAICGLFSSTVREAGMSQYDHVQGEINALAKLDRHYYGLFGFFALKDNDIWTHSPNPQSALRIRNAIKWFHANNHLYSNFFAQYETLLKYLKPSFINPTLLQEQNISLDQLLEDEAVGMAFPLDANYFDNFPAMTKDWSEDIAGRQCPRPEAHRILQDLTRAKYGEKYLDCKSFPHLHPWGHGGWYNNCQMPFNAHIKMRLFDIRGLFAEDPCYPFFKYDWMCKVRLRMYNAQTVIQVEKLSQPLNASKVSNSDPYSVYGSKMPRIVPGSKQFWRSFGLDLIAFVEERGIPDFFLTLTAHDGWPQLQSTLKDGWGASAQQTDTQDLASALSDRQPVGRKPHVSVLAAEKRYEWFMSILRSPTGGPLGIVEDLIMKKEYQRRGAVHWHILLWVKPNSSPNHAVMAELPRSSDTNNKCAAYLRKLVQHFQAHKTCHPSRCFRGSHGKTLSKCKYGFPFDVPNNTLCLDNDCVRYLYTRRHQEDTLIVPYNPEIAILWGAAHNVQRVSKHGFEMYLAKYISKPEPSLSIQLPQNCSEPQRYLRTRVIGSVETIEVLMGFHQNQMSRQVIFLQTELTPSQKMLKPKHLLHSLNDDSEDIYLRTKFDTYLQRPHQLKLVTYPHFFQWWRSAGTDEQKKAENASNTHSKYIVKCKGTDEFKDFLACKAILERCQQTLADALNKCDPKVENQDQLLTLKRSLQYKDTPTAVIQAVIKHYASQGIDTNDRLHFCASFHTHSIVDTITTAIAKTLPNIQKALCSYHWLMDTNPPITDQLTTILTTYPPGTVLVDQNGHYWIRRGKMVMTRHRYLNSVGDDAEKYYEQKFLLTIPMTQTDPIITNPPSSWVELCASRGMCDGHLDALSCLQSAISKGFHVDQIRTLTQLYMDHGFLSGNEADAFLTSIPVLGEQDNEPNTIIPDQMLNDPQNGLPSFGTPSETDLNALLPTFTESQTKAYKWIANKFVCNEQVFAAIIGPAGTGKSYLLKGLIGLAKTHNLVVTKLAPSGVAAHLIGGTTIHNFFSLDIDCNSSLQNGTIPTTTLRKTDILVIDEFSMLDFFLFRTAEGLCRKFSKHQYSSLPWGGRHVILLGDPAQLPSVSRQDVFGTRLWRSFHILLLREIKRSIDPTLTNILTQIRMGICNDDVKTTLATLVQSPDCNKLDLDKSVVICSTRRECSIINDRCINKIQGDDHIYEALDTDHHGNPIRDTDRERIKRHRERLPDILTLKIGARVVLRRNIDINAGWVNGTFATVTSLHKNCVVIAKLTNPSHRYPVPRWRQKIPIEGASYSILRQQFPLELAYAVTVHRVQGCTVQKAVVCLGKTFFESGQAYVALSRVRSLSDLTLWEFQPSAICLHSFYKQLLLWCDYVDVIRPTPATEIITYPQRIDDVSEQPLTDACISDTPTLTMITLLNTSTTTQPDTPKRCRGRPRKRPCNAPTQGSSASKRQKCNVSPPQNTPTTPSTPHSTHTPPTKSTDPPPQTAHKTHLLATISPLSVNITRFQTAATIPKSTRTMPLSQNPTTSTNILLTSHEAGNIHPQVPTPSLSWKNTACQLLEQMTGLPIVNKTTTPDPIVLSDSSEIIPNIRDAVIGDGHCLFRAISKEVTGTESNFNVFRHIAALYLRTNPQLVSYIYTRYDRSITDSTHIERYITNSRLLQRGWGSDVEIRAISTVLNIDIYTFCTSGHSRLWEKSYSFTSTATTPVTSNAIYLFHTINQNHYDRVVITQ